MAIHKIPDWGEKNGNIVFVPLSNSRRKWALSIAWIIWTSALVVGLMQNEKNDTSLWSDINKGKSWNSWAISGGGIIQIPSQNGDTLARKNPTENNEESLEVSWKSDPEIVEMMNQVLARKEKAAFLNNVSKMSKEKQLLLLEALKEFWLLKEAVENLRYFTAISKTDIQSYLFGGILLWVNYREIIWALKASDKYTDNEIMQLFIKQDNKRIFYESLDLLTQNPFGFLKNLLWTTDQMDLGRYYDKYKSYLTAEQLNELEALIKAQNIPRFGRLNMTESERVLSIKTSISEGTFDFLHIILKPDDQINKADLLAKMLSANDYLSILENSMFLWLQPYQIVEYSRAALRTQMELKSAWGIFSQLIWNWIIPDIVLPEVIGALDKNENKLLIILNQARLLDLYWSKRAYAELMNNWLYIWVANFIFTLKPTRQEAYELIKMLSNQNNEYHSSHIGKVIKYIDSLK